MTSSYEDLRAQVLSPENIRMAVKTPEDGAPYPPVLGVALEESMDAGSYFVFGLLSGTASLYLSSGGGSLGGEGQAPVKNAAIALTTLGAGYADKAPVVEAAPVPAANRVQFILLGADGIRAIEFAQSEVSSDGHEWQPLYAAAHEVITAFRVASGG